MMLQVIRYSSAKESTLGVLVDVTDGRKKFLAYTLEDEARTVKVYGETRIPAGRYGLALHKSGEFHEKYTKKFPSIHKGMLLVQNVPNFQWILIHCGNTDKDTAGCLLVGDSAVQNITKPGFIGESVAAYERIYPAIAAVLLKGGKVEIEYIDLA